jgi:hypothetical protein
VQDQNIFRRSARSWGGWELDSKCRRAGLVFDGLGWRCCRYGESFGGSRIACLYKINSAPFRSPTILPPSTC